MPGKWRFVAGGLLIAAGAIGFAIFLVARLSGFSDSLERIEIPGTRDLPLANGSYTIYWEHAGLFATVPDLECWAKSKSTGRYAMVGTNWGTSRYSTGGRRGISIREFEIMTGDEYEVGARYRDGRTGPLTTIAVGKDSGFKIVTTVLIGLGILGGGIALGLGLIIPTALRRKRAPQ